MEKTVAVEVEVVFLVRILVDVVLCFRLGSLFQKSLTAGVAKGVTGDVAKDTTVVDEMDVTVEVLVFRLGSLFTMLIAGGVATETIVAVEWTVTVVFLDFRFGSLFSMSLTAGVWSDEEEALVMRSPWTAKARVAPKRRVLNFIVAEDDGIDFGGVEINDEQ